MPGYRQLHGTPGQGNQVLVIVTGILTLVASTLNDDGSLLSSICVFIFFVKLKKSIQKINPKEKLYVIFKRKIKILFRI